MPGVNPDASLIKGLITAFEKKDQENLTDDEKNVLKKLVKALKRKHLEEEGKSMCDLLDEAEMKGIQKGMQQGMQKGIQVLITTCKDFGISFEETITKLKEKYSLKEEEAQRDMKLYW